jgi:hypothetical protein
MGIWIPLASATTQYPNGNMDAHIRKKKKKLKHEKASLYSVPVVATATRAPSRHYVKLQFSKRDNYRACI